MRVVADVDPALLLRRRDLVRAQGRRRLALLLAAALVVVATGAFLLLRSSSAFSVHAVSVSGADARLSAQVKRAVAAGAEGRNLLALDTGALARQVEALPDVRSAAVDRAFPHGLRIRVTPYVPALAVQVGAGSHARRFLLARNGQVLDAPVAPARGVVHVDLPAGSTLVVGRRAGDANVRAALAVMHDAQRFRALFGRLRRVVPRSGTVVAFVGRRLQLRLGQADRIDLKLRVAARVMRRIGDQQRQTISYLDVSVPSRPALGLRSNA